MTLDKTAIFDAAFGVYAQGDGGVAARSDKVSLPLLA